MKKIIFSLLLFCFVGSVNSENKWTQLKSGTTNMLTYVDFLNKDTGIGLFVG
jgi:hypothetical protein